LTSNKELFIECIDSLFLKLELAYHYQFYKVFGTDDRLNEGKKVWAQTLKKFSTDQILTAIEEIISEHEYLPTLTDVVLKCKKNNIAAEEIPEDMLKEKGFDKDFFIKLRKKHDL
tara:strand:+ start:18260 stop:18604 length:345 start_codon:yes stop_codon:yes gene_type:complete